ncbi:DNA helicase PIF1/RRM3 [Handroanthus impetiginosus]|uniref:ATP-dependent DNA helicase n=1 Tax=Handroanthus impetiginosus TaxID=429701 RepID=A0A2G9FX41_9LAMI|nr:DNA helicase PIF1/RRM3 [Handroanthus impetiginosus]
MDNIRALNSIFSFTFMGEKIDKSVQDRKGPPCFKIHGENYHQIRSLLPPPRLINSFVQLYICDLKNEVHNRINAIQTGGSNLETLASIVEGLKLMLDDVNSYVQVFCRAGDALQLDSGVNLRIRILNSREIWKEPHFCGGGRLFNVVDCHAAIEQPRLNDIKTHQIEIRVDLYKGLEDAVIAGDTNASAVGRRVILPSSFTGVPHNMINIIKMQLLYVDQLDIHVIEFQKQRLPYSHMTITLEEQDKLISTDDIDELICTKIPDKDTNPLAYKTMIRCMIHGPCGPYNPNASCMIDGKCSKYYSKKLNAKTTIDEMNINGVEIDNRWIIPYNCDLLVLFNAHINVEKCASPKVMKYMHKYIYKGVDRATIVVANNIDGLQENERQVYRHTDEIKQYLDCRYFEANKKYTETRTLTFVEFPTKYVWKWDKKDWVMKKQGKCIRRFPYAYPNSREKYYLRILLYKVCGAQCFEDIKAFNGSRYLHLDKHKTIIVTFRSQKKIVLLLTSSGIATLLLPGGRTTHSRFKIPFELDKTSCCPISLNTKLAKLIQKAALIIWDEAPMMHIIKTTNFSEQKPLGGKLCMLGENFKQILPVVTKDRHESIVMASLHKSELWNQYESMQSIDGLRSFDKWINLIGERKARCLHFDDRGESNWIEIPKKLLIENNNNSLMKLIDATYPQLTNRYNDATYLKVRPILAPRNSDVDEINSKMQSMLFCNREQNMYPPKLLHYIKFSSISDHCLELKKDAQVILLRNLNQPIGEKVLEARVIIGSHMGEAVLIPRIILTITASQTFVPMKRRQFPVKLAFAMTINKSQGQTLDRVGLYLPSSVFSHGQLYVALSRVTNSLGLKILISNKLGLPRNCTRNVVYPEVLAAVYE